MPNQPVNRGELRRVLWWMEGILLVLVIVLGGLGIASLNLQKQHDSEVSAIKHLEELHGADLSSIQEQRESSLLETCGKQNTRNHSLTVFMDGLPTVKKAGKKEKELLQRFVNALAPHEDCRALLAKRVGMGRKEPAIPPLARSPFGKLESGP